MASRKFGLRDVVVEHPVIDQLPAIAVVGFWFAFGRSIEVNYVPEFLTGLATVSALVLAAATFVCSLTYQSSSPRVVDVRAAYGTQMNRNWVSIFAMTFVTSVAPLIALLFVGAGPLAPAIAVWAAAMLAVKATRTLYWLKMMVFTQYVDDVRPKTQWPPVRSDSRSA